MAAVAVILPCYGRYAQTLRYAARMVAVAGEVDAAWIAVGGTDESATIDALVDTGPWAGVCGPEPRLSYWEALTRGTTHSGPHSAPTGLPGVLCAVANDVWAGDDWLQRGLVAYHARFADGEGLMGFAGDGHGVDHACHFLIGRRLLDHLGGWPTHYRHNFGDTELCQRAQAMGRYAKARHAVLEHRHVWHGTAPDDAVYAAGRERWDADAALFERRKAKGWA